MWLFSWFVSHGYTPFRGPLLVASSNRDLASSASLLVLGPPVMGSAGCFCSLLSPLLECSAWHSLDTCLVSYDGVGSTHDGRRACCCFGLLLGSPVLGSAGCDRCDHRFRLFLSVLLGTSHCTLRLFFFLLAKNFSIRRQQKNPFFIFCNPTLC